MFSKLSSQDIQGIENAFKAFKNNSGDIEGAIVSSTEASWAGDGYSVELFPDGTYRVVCDYSIGNKYDAASAIIGIPTLGSEEWDEEDGHYYDGAIEQLDLKFQQWKTDTLEYMQLEQFM